MPLALLLVAAFWPVAVWSAKRVPALCETVAGERVVTGRPESPTRAASFAVHVHGWGNPRSFGLTGGVVVYTGAGRKFEDLYFDFEKNRGHWTNSYTTFFPLTREAVAEYVRRSDDFPPGEAEAVADRVWDTLVRYEERRDLPPMTDHFYQGDEPRIVYYVPTATAYLVACLFSLLASAAVSWRLLRWYDRRAAEVPYWP